MTKNVFTISPTLCFSDTLAAELMKMNNPEELAQITLFLPTRRACKTMRDAFLRQSAGTPMLLPKMIPFGSLDNDDTLTSLSVAGAEDIPPAISPLRRRLLLAKLVRQKQPDGLSAEKALQLADALAAFLDESTIEQTDLSLLKNLVPDTFAAHWQETLKFLEIITAMWPAILKEEGVIDAADRQVRLFKAQADYWRENPPPHPIIAAGSTGSQPATAGLLDAIASLPNGMVILPGLDLVSDDETFAAIEPSHPQYHLKRLLERMGIAREEVGEFGQKAADSERLRLICEAMRPAATTDKWQSAKPFAADALRGIERVDCATLQEEALVIALALRETLETPEKTAALITPDRSLARRVVAEMNRWGVVMDDSAGVPLSLTPLGIFLNLVGQVGLSNAAPFDLLACLKHPLAAGGMKYGSFRPQVRALELTALRGKRPGDGFDGLLKAAADKAFVQTIADCLGDFTALMQSKEPHPFSQYLTAHLTAAEALAQSDDRCGADRLWVGDAGEAALNLIADAQENADLIDDMMPADYPAMFAMLASGALVRPKFGMHPRLDILGTMEARLIRPDLLILGGLNEGSWPKTIEADPWLSRPMRAECAMPMPERKIALSAHDFCQAFCAPNVLLTRSLKSGGTPTVPSRWLMRLDAVLNASGLKWEAGTKQAWSKQLDAPNETVAFQPPRPCPPVAARPRSLSVTQVETLFRDPYSIYARHILGLKPLDDIDLQLNVADFGSALHKAVELFCSEHPDSIPPNAEAELFAIGEKAIAELNFSITAAAFWKPRVFEALKWFLARQRERIDSIRRIYPEQTGQAVLPMKGGDFTLTGRADRIDVMKDGSISIIDYKTGVLPTEKTVLAGYSPQLPLEAEIIRRRGFENLPQGEVKTLEYWRLRGASDGGRICKISADTDELTAAALERLIAAIEAFDNPETPYLPTPDTSVSQKYNDYDHLARFDEWATREETEDGDDGND